MQTYLFCFLTYQLWINVNAIGETTQTNQNNCVDIECTLCKAHYFVYQLPQYNDEIIESESRICVECPFQAFMQDEENLYCGDCLDNSQTWNFNRVCGYDYLTYSTENSVYHKKDRASAELFYVVNSGSGYTTMICKGCDHFCKEKSQNCFLVPKEYQNDINYMYVSCKEGYEFDEQRQMCISCPQNCLSCYQNTCLICNQGFSKLTLRESKENQTKTTFCIPCFEQCKSCYFGKNEINLNVLPWDDFNNKEGLYTKNFKENQFAFFEELFNVYKIAQRCEQCDSTTQIKFIPSLNRRSCVQCGTQCQLCEYYTYWLEQEKLKSPSQNTLRVIEPQNEKETQELLESQYVLRCRECRNFNQTFNAMGTGCSDCKINDCVLCHKSEIQKQRVSFSTLSVNFESQPQEDGFMEKCVLCKDGYYLSETGMCLIFDSQNYPEPGCLTFERSYDLKHCRKCQQGYILQFDSQHQIWNCINGCEIQLQDPNCESCVQQGEEFRCQICKVGYYVDTITKKCKPCSIEGYCLKCYTLTLNVVHHPEYFSTSYSEDSSQNEVMGPFCYQCIPDDSEMKGRGHFLNEDQRKCEKGGEKCQIFLARGQKGFCDQCLNQNSRSSSPNGNDCIDCPNNTIGCRERSQEEIQQYNRFYEPTHSLDKYSTLAFKCTQGSNQLETKVGRCLQTVEKDRQINIFVKADCSNDQEVNKNLVWEINDLFQVQQNKFSGEKEFDKFLSKNATIILETKAFLSDNVLEQVNNLNYAQLYEDLNNRAINKIIINVIFSQSDPSCFFQKDTYFTTNIKKEVFSVQEIELNIKVENDHIINWYLQNNIYFEYFSKVTISGINIQPAVDCELFPQIKKLQKPFSLQFIKNDGLVVKLENMIIQNYAAYKHYLNKDLYTTPYSQMSILNKKFTPFYFIFTNVYDLQLTDVVIQSLNYLLLKDTNYQFNLFGFNYEPHLLLPYFYLQIQNVKYSDIGIENQAIFDLEQINIKQQSKINFKIIIQQVSINDVYFLNGAGFMSPKFNNSLNGLVQINNLIVNNTNFNNSRGIINFNNMKQMIVTNFTLLNSIVNDTVLYHISTIQIAKCYVQNTQFSSNGRMIQTQHELSKISKPNYERLKFVIEDIIFQQVRCLTPQCLISISGIKNNYDIPINVTMKDIDVIQIQTDGFDHKILNATTSAAIKIEKSYTVYVQNFQSLENSNLSILYVDQVWKSYFYNINCHQTKNLLIRNNYCLFVNNLYKSVKLVNVQLLNLNAQDNSFIGITSWNNLIYNTTTQDSQESIFLEQVLVQSCTVTTTQPGIPSSSIIIQSNQQQNVQLIQMEFLWNKHVMLIPGSLSPSNPTLIMQNSLGNLILKNSKWVFNTVQGSGAALYLESGVQTITNIKMLNNNDPYSRGALEVDQPNQGGHLMMISQQATIDNCTFYNSTAKYGGSIFIKTVKQGWVLINNTIIQSSLTQLDSTIDSKGGCLYVDSKASKLNMTIINTIFKDCLSRQEGGAIYMQTYQSQQQLLIQDTSFTNCFSLSGSILKVNYDKNQLQTQQTKMVNIDIQADQTNQERFFSSLGELKETEKYMFLIRSHAIEQDFGEIILINVKSQGLLYQGFLSVRYSSFIKLSSIIVQNYILAYIPLIEIMEPILNPVLIETMKIANISSIDLENIQCYSQISDMICKIHQIRVDFPEIMIQPSLMRIDTITPATYLTLSTVLINKINCPECIYGLVQITSVSIIKLIQLVYIDQCRCTDTNTAYYGCFAISSESHIKMQTDQDKLYNFTIKTNLTKEAIMNYTGIIPSSDKFYTQQYRERQLTNEKIFQYIIPDPPYTSHVVVISLFIENNTCFHGCGLSIYELTTNITSSYCTQNQAFGRGAFLNFESKTQQRINIAQCSCYNNKASIGGCIALLGVYINDIIKTENQITRNEATLFGDNINTLPQKMAFSINGIQQNTTNLTNETELIPTPILIQSGYPLGSYLDQSVQIYFLDNDFQIVKYQFQAFLQINIGTQVQQTRNPINCEESIQNLNMQFQNEFQGFDLSNLKICFNPNLNKYINLTFTSIHIQKPVFIDQYPYAFKEYQKSNYSLIIKFQPISCRLGEYYNQFNYQCIQCPQSYYLLQLNSSLCKGKDQNTMKDTFGSQIMLYEGYWRPKINNDQVQKCRQQKCLGGLQVGNELCAPGSIGALCEECDIHMVFWDQRYFKNWQSNCQLCDDINIKLQDGFVILTQILITIFLGWLTLVGRERNVYLNMQKILKFSQWKKKQQISPQAFLIIIYHMQILSFLRFFNLENSANSFFIGLNSITMPALSLKVHLQCIFQDDLYLRLIYSLTFVILGCFLTLINFYRIGRISQKSNFLILVFIYIQPSYLIELLQLANYRVISGQKYNYANVSYLFDGNQSWEQIFVILCLTLIAFVPIIICGYFYKFYYKTKEYKKFDFLRKWGMIYSYYSKRALIPEFIIRQFKLILYSLISLNDQIYFMFPIIIFCIFLQNKSRQNVVNSQKQYPYTSKLNNKLESLSHTVIILSCLISTIFYKQNWGSFNFSAVISLFIINIYYLGVCFYYLIFKKFIQWSQQKLWIQKVNSKQIKKNKQMLQNIVKDSIKNWDRSRKFKLINKKENLQNPQQQGQEQQQQAQEQQGQEQEVQEQQILY